MDGSPVNFSHIIDFKSKWLIIKTESCELAKALPAGNVSTKPLRIATTQRLFYVLLLNQVFDDLIQFQQEGQASSLLAMTMNNAECRIRMILFTEDVPYMLKDYIPGGDPSTPLGMT